MVPAIAVTPHGPIAPRCSGHGGRMLNVESKMANIYWQRHSVLELPWTILDSPFAN